jgi:hypothetical protein
MGGDEIFKPRKKTYILNATGLLHHTLSMSVDQGSTLTRITELPWLMSQHTFLCVTVSRCSWFHIGSFSVGTKDFFMVVKWIEREADHLSQMLR